MKDQRENARKEKEQPPTEVPKHRKTEAPPSSAISAFQNVSVSEFSKTPASFLSVFFHLGQRSPTASGNLKIKI
jgi:hypothetical protein